MNKTKCFTVSYKYHCQTEWIIPVTTKEEGRKEGSKGCIGMKAEGIKTSC